MKMLTSPLCYFTLKEKTLLVSKSDRGATKILFSNPIGIETICISKITSASEGYERPFASSILIGLPI